MNSKYTKKINLVISESHMKLTLSRAKLAVFKIFTWHCSMAAENKLPDWQLQ